MYCKAVEKSWHLGLAWKVLKISDCLGRGADVVEGSNFGKLRKDLSGGSTEYMEKSFGDDANGRPWISLQTNDHSKNGLQSHLWKFGDSYAHMSHGRFGLVGPEWSLG